MVKTINILTFINIIYFLESNPLISIIFVIFLIIFNREVLKDVY